MLSKLIVIAGAAVCTVVVSAVPTMAQWDVFKLIYFQSFCLEASLSGPQEHSSLVFLLTLALVSS